MYNIPFFRSIGISQTEFIDYYKKLNDPNFKGALAASFDTFSDLNQLNYGNHTSKICQDCLFTYQYGIYFGLNSYLVLPFNYWINQLQANGMLNYWESQSMDPKYFKAIPAPKEPRKLNFQQLTGSFIILSAGLFAALLLFGVEIISIKYQLIVNTFEWIVNSS